MPETTPPPDLARDQKALGEALLAAQAGHDLELANRVRDDGLQLARLLYGLLRMTRVHSSENEAFDKPLGELTAAIARLVDLLGVVHLYAVEDQFYVNEVRVRFQERGEGAGDIGSELRRLSIGGVTFHSTPTQDQLRLFVQGFGRPPLGATNREGLAQRLQAKGIASIELQGMFRFRTSGEELRADGTTDPSQVARRATEELDAAWQGMVSGRIPNPLPLRRAVTELLQAGIDLDGLWEDPPGATHFAAHTFRVTRYALLVGQALGLAEEAMQDLGLAAMLHDVGYADRSGPTPDLAWHPGAGALLLLRQRGFHEAKIRRALATLEHHRDYDHPGGRPSLFARVLRICEDYDNLLRVRGGGCSPPQALAQLVTGAEQAYDPVILQVFVNLMGQWPPGTLLQLEDGRQLRSIGTARSLATWNRPVCRLERDAAGVALSPPYPHVDLASGGRVVKVLDGA